MVREVPLVYDAILDIPREGSEYLRPLFLVASCVLPRFYQGTSCIRCVTIVVCFDTTPGRGAVVVTILRVNPNRFMIATRPVQTELLLDDVEGVLIDLAHADPEPAVPSPIPGIRHLVASES